MTTHSILRSALAVATLAAAVSVAGAQGVSDASRPLTLGDAARLAARNSASSAVARARVGEAQARVAEQRAALLPQLTGVGTHLIRDFNTASFGFTFPSVPGQPPLFDPKGQVEPPFLNVDMRGRLAQPLFDFGAISRVRSAQATVRSANADVSAAAEAAGSNAALAYLRALRASDELRARSEDSVFAADLVTIAQAQLQAGTGVLLDVTRARSQLAATHANLIASRAARDRSRIELARALGLPLDQQLPIVDSLAALDSTALTTDVAAATTRAITSRPDVVAAEARAAAARQSVSAIRAERLPTLSFFGDDGVNGKTYRTLLNTYEYGFQVSLPLLDGFRREARIREQEGVAREADIQRRDLEAQAAADVQTALLDVQSSREGVAAARDRVQLAEQEVSQARERFRAGVAGNADVITALLSLTNARTALIDAETTYQTARISLARAQGSVTTLP